MIPMKRFWSLMAVLPLLVFVPSLSYALSLSQALSSAANVDRGYRRAQEEQIQREMARIQLQQARTQAQIMELERLKKLQEYERQRAEYQNLQKEVAAQLAEIKAQKQKLDEERIEFQRYQNARVKYDQKGSLSVEETAVLLKPLVPREVEPGIILFAVGSNQGKLYLSLSYKSLEKDALTEQKAYNFFYNEIDVYLATACREDVLVRLIDRNSIITFSVFDRAKRFIDRVEINKADCSTYLSAENKPKASLKK